MSEIKGQLLGIILTLMVFAAVSVTIATVYNQTASKVTEHAQNVEQGASQELESGNTGAAIAAPGSVAYPAIHY